MVRPSQNSIADVVLEDARFRHLRKEVGPATVFWSHVAAEGVLAGGSGVGH